MRSRTWLPMLAAVSLSATFIGCGGNPRPQVGSPERSRPGSSEPGRAPGPLVRQPPAAPPAQSPAVPQPASTPAPADPVAKLIETSQKHFEAGERELKLGHLDRARVEFDRAVDVLLESQHGARTDARLREHFDRLIDRISAHEVAALAAGDGFAEKKYEPASIDELLKIATFPKPDSKAETKHAVEADLAATAHDIPIPLNERVLSAVELLQGRLRDYVQDSLTRGARYLPMIQNVFRAEGLPLDLAFIPIIESGFKTNALSKAKAKGPWQFMIPTAQDRGLKTDWFIDERSDFEKSTVAAAQHLKMLSGLFEGDWHLVLAAYNGGQGRVLRAMKSSGRADFWNLTQSSRYLPKETREYVPLILAAMVIGRNPAQYGFELAAADALAYDKVSIDRAIDLRRVAEWTDSTVDEIQALNPELRRWTTPLKYPDYELKLPAGTAEQFKTRLASARSSDLNTLNWYTVRRGESLATIARKLRVSKTELASANSLSTKSKVRTGQELVIPRAPATLLATRTERSAPPVLASRPVSGTATVPDAVRASSRPSTTYYKVKRGDTLFSIARLFNTTVDSLRSLNRLRDNALSVGKRLLVKTR